MTSRAFHNVASLWHLHQESMVKAGRISAPTLRSYAKALRPLVDHFGAADVSALTTIQTDNYAAWRRTHGAGGRTVKSSTINHELQVLRSILTYASDAGLLSADPPRVRSMPNPTIEEDLPDTAVIAAIVDRLPPHHAMALRFSALTGLSWHEVQRLQWRDIDPWRKLINVGRRSTFITKTAARIRSVPITKEVATLLRRVQGAQRGTVAGEAPVFPAAGGTAKALLRDRRHGEPEVTPAMMRKLFSATLAAKRVPEAQLQRLLGHAPGSKVTRKHYIRSQAAMLAEAMEIGGKVL